MRLVPTGNGSEVVERYDVDRCSGCQGLLTAPHAVLGWKQCTCAGTSGHRTWWCRDCRSWTYDPPHDPATPNVVGGAGYFGS